VVVVAPGAPLGDAGAVLVRHFDSVNNTRKLVAGGRWKVQICRVGVCETAVDVEVMREMGRERSEGSAARERTDSLSTSIKAPLGRSAEEGTGGWLRKERRSTAHRNETCVFKGTLTWCRAAAPPGPRGAEMQLELSSSFAPDYPFDKTSKWEMAATLGRCGEIAASTAVCDAGRGRNDTDRRHTTLAGCTV